MIRQSHRASCLCLVSVASLASLGLVVNPKLADRVPSALRARIGAARDSIVAGTLRVPRVEFVVDTVPVAGER